MPFTSLVHEMAASLKAFQSSSARFRILKTIAPVRLSPSPQIGDLQTLFIFDSSFNPPSKAHAWLARSAVSSPSPPNTPSRLMLLLSTKNADKAPTAAPFSVRLALMTLLAQDLASSHTPPIDIAVTTEPYYSDKSDAITREGPWAGSCQPKHVHIMGFDTITRFLGKKYYVNQYDPPLKAVAPFFEAGHEVRVTLRPSEDPGDLDMQKMYFHGIREGDMERDGLKKEWGLQITVVQPDEQEKCEVESISSTRIREASKAGAIELVESMCTPSVAKAILGRSIYDSQC